VCGGLVFMSALLDGLFRARTVAPCLPRPIRTSICGRSHRMRSWFSVEEPSRKHRSRGSNRTVGCGMSPHSGPGCGRTGESRLHWRSGRASEHSSTHPVNRIEFRPDGRALLVDASPTTRLWDLPRRQTIGEPIIDEVSCGFRRDGGAFLAVGSDGTVKLRDAATAAVISSLLSSTSPATCAAFRSDGALVVAGFADGTARLCDPATSQPVGPPRLLSHGVHHVAFAPEGRTFAAIDEFGESRCWPVAEPVADAELDDLTLRIEARTGLRMDTGQVISRLDDPAWRDRLERLGQLDPTALQPDNDSAWHELMLSEAERNGHAFAALWHLDRLIAARPDDWSLYARRARARSLPTSPTGSRRPPRTSGRRSGGAPAKRSWISRLSAWSTARKPGAGPRPSGISTA
jgi:hypothetical protein